MSAIGRRDFAAAERLLTVPSVGLSSKFLRGYYQCLRGWLAFEQGDIETALRLNKESLALAHELGFHLGQCHTATSHVVYEAARGDRAGVAQALAQLDSCLGQTPSPFYSTGADLVRAYARLCNGEHPKDELRSALGRARRLGYGIFLSSKVIARLVAAALEYEVEIDCAHELIRDYALDPGPHVYALAAWPWPVKIRTLGTLSIIVDGRALEFGRKPANVPLALLKMLAASAEPVPFERMTKALWPGYGANAPRGTLDTAIYRLRKMLGSEAAVRTANGGIGLDPNVCWTDTRAFALCCDRIADIATTAGELVDGIDVAHCEHRLFDLYRGPLDAHREPRQICRARDQLHQQFRRAIADLDRLWARLANDRRRTKLRELAASRDVQA